MKPLGEGVLWWCVFPRLTLLFIGVNLGLGLRSLAEREASRSASRRAQRHVALSAHPGALLDLGFF